MDRYARANSNHADWEASIQPCTQCVSASMHVASRTLLRIQTEWHRAGKRHLGEKDTKPSAYSMEE